MNKETMRHLSDLKAFVEKKGIVKDEIVKRLMDMRPLFIQQNEPLITRVVRLTAEYIADRGVFDLNLLAEEDEDGIIEEDIDMDADDSFNLSTENFLYLLDLFAHPDNQLNKEELQRIKAMYLGRDLF